MVEERIAAIEERNQRVHMDKAWERSHTRRGVIAIMTYLTAGVFMSVNHFLHPWITALVPVLGYILSTLSLPWIKQYWLSRQKQL